LIEMDLLARHVELLAAEGVGDVAVGDRPERLPLGTDLELERERRGGDPRRELLRVDVLAVLLGLGGLTVGGDTTKLSGARHDREPAWKEEVLGVAIGHVFDLAGPAEARDLLLQDDAHFYALGVVGGSGTDASCCSLRR